MNPAKCFEKHRDNLDKKDFKAINDASKKYRESGLGVVESAVRAAQEQIDSIEGKPKIAKGKVRSTVEGEAAVVSGMDKAYEAVMARIESLVKMRKCLG